MKRNRRCWWLCILWLFLRRWCKVNVSSSRTAWLGAGLWAQVTGRSAVTRVVAALRRACWCSSRRTPACCPCRECLRCATGDWGLRGTCLSSVLLCGTKKKPCSYSLWSLEFEKQLEIRGWDALFLIFHKSKIEAALCFQLLQELCFCRLRSIKMMRICLMWTCMFILKVGWFSRLLLVLEWILCLFILRNVRNKRNKVWKTSVTPNCSQLGMRVRPVLENDTAGCHWIWNCLLCPFLEPLLLGRCSVAAPNLVGQLYHSTVILHTAV